MAIDREAMKNSMAERLNERSKMQNKSSSGYETYFTLPEGVSQFKIKPTPEGIDYGFDIIPFFAGNNYPTNGYNIKKGTNTYILDVHVHFNVGPNKKAVVCPLKNYNLPCPLCEKRDEEKVKRGKMSTEDWAQFKKDLPELFVKQRAIYNIICRSDEKEEAKGTQIYEASNHFSEKKFVEAKKMWERRNGGGVCLYPDGTVGKTIWQTFKLLGDNWGVSDPMFEERNYAITDEEIQSATALDQIITVLSYDEILGVMGIRQTKRDEYEDDEDNSPPVVNRRGLKQEVVEPEPTGPITEEDVPLEFKDDPKPVSETATQVCPYGGEFAKEFDDYQECDNCAIRSDCKFAKEEAEKAVKAPAKRRKVLNQ